MKRIVTIALAATLQVALLAPVHSSARPPLLQRRVLHHLNAQAWVSSGLRAWLHPQVPGPAAPRPPAPGPALGASGAFGTNVDAADPSEDLAGGQSETAIAAGTFHGQRRVLVAWNDISGQFATDPTSPAASGTGVGYSSDGGASFTDLVGLPNGNPEQQWAGDPSIAAVDDGQAFIVGSLYFPSFQACGDGNPSQLTVAVSVGTVDEPGTGISFGDPVVAAQAGNVCSLRRRPPKGLSLLDKEWVGYDQASRTLVVAYIRFFMTRGHSGLGQVEMVRAHVPATPSKLSSRDFGPPVVVWKEEHNCPRRVSSSETRRCGAVNEGPFPVVAPGGDTYVAWERNISSNLFDGDPYVYMHAALVPAGATTPSVGGPSDPRVVTLGQAGSNADGGVRSLVGEIVAGYNRFEPGPNDFPQAAVRPLSGQVVLVWEDASQHLLGDVWMRAADLSLSSFGAIRRVNDDSDGVLHFMPAVSVGAADSVITSWFDRRLWGPDSTRTDYFAEITAGPGVAAPDFRVTTDDTDWNGVSTRITPNFGDYTDSATDGSTPYFTWSDGRLGFPQPFVDSAR
jgi:hypothetical protein